MSGWEIEFWEDENGKEPFQVFLDELPEPRRLSMIAAIERVLQREGPNVCESEWGKNLGDGTYEFRVRHSADEIKAMFPARAARPGVASSDSAQKRRRKSRGEIVLRAFFAVDENRLILMTGGYDKGKDPSERRQRIEIDRNKARVRLIREAIRRRKKALRDTLARERAKQRDRKRRKR